MYRIDGLHAEGGGAMPYIRPALELHWILGLLRRLDETPFTGDLPLREFW